MCVLIIVYFSLSSVLWYCWLGLLTCKTVSLITYTVLVETLALLTHSLTVGFPYFMWSVTDCGADSMMIGSV